jgi:hypothetical protein
MLWFGKTLVFRTEVGMLKLVLYHFIFIFLWRSSLYMWDRGALGCVFLGEMICVTMEEQWHSHISVRCVLQNTTRTIENPGKNRGSQI